MKYISVSQVADKWGISERSVRNYCSQGRIPGVVLDGKTWKIPESAVKPERKKRAGKIPDDLLARLKLEKKSQFFWGIFHKIHFSIY